MKHLRLALLIVAVTPGAAPVKPPNVVFILADDFDYAGLKCYGRGPVGAFRLA